MTEIVKAEKNDLLTPDDIRMIREFDEIKKRYKVWEDVNRERLSALLDGEESYKQDGVVVYMTKPYKKKQVDTKRLKEEGLYELYTHDVWVKGSLRVQVEYDD